MRADAQRNHDAVLAAAKAVFAQAGTDGFLVHWEGNNDLSRTVDRIKALGADVVAIMPETQEYAARFKTEADAPFPVLTDLDNGYALSLNLAIWLGVDIERLLSYLDVAGFYGNDGWVLPIPATFVVGRDCMIKARFVDPDFRRRMAIEDLLIALKDAR